MTETEANGKILALTVFLILLILSATLGAGYGIYLLLSLAGLQLSTNLPVEFRLAGLVALVAGLTIGLAVLMIRRPIDVLVSTSDTFMKLVGRKPIGKTVRRTEPFIPKGPYKYVRNPMYFTVLAFVFGLGLAYSSTLLLLWGAVLVCWFYFALIPFEEKELEALFGEGYSDYRQQVPMLFPYGKRYKGKAR